MINYDEMKNVIKKLNEYVDKLQSFVDVQKKLDNTITEYVLIEENIKGIKSNIKEYDNKITKLENTYANIYNLLEQIMQDYKKLHSTFELVEIELKKNNEQNDIILRTVKEQHIEINRDMQNLAKSNLNEIIKTKENLQLEFDQQNKILEEHFLKQKKFQEEHNKLNTEILENTNKIDKQNDMHFKTIKKWLLSNTILNVLILLLVIIFFFLK